MVPDALASILGRTTSLISNSFLASLGLPTAGSPYIEAKMVNPNFLSQTRLSNFCRGSIRNSSRSAKTLSSALLSICVNRCERGLAQVAPNHNILTLTKQ